MLHKAGQQNSVTFLLVNTFKNAKSRVICIGVEILVGRAKLELTSHLFVEHDTRSRKKHGHQNNFPAQQRNFNATYLYNCITNH